MSVPNPACDLARRARAPNPLMVYKAGVIGAQPRRLPLSAGDPASASGAAAVYSIFDILMRCPQRGNVDAGFPGGAQIGRFGNINPAVIGVNRHPKARLPRSDGSMEAATRANRCQVMTPLQKRCFPEKAGFITSAGLLKCIGDWEPVDLRGSGAQATVTCLGIPEPDESGEPILSAPRPGATLSQRRRTPAGRCAARVRRAKRGFQRS